MKKPFLTAFEFPVFTLGETRMPALPTAISNGFFSLNYIVQLSIGHLINPHDAFVIWFSTSSGTSIKRKTDLL